MDISTLPKWQGIWSLEDLDVGRVIGTGAFAEVRLARDRRTGEQLALKIANRKTLRQRHGITQSPHEPHDNSPASPLDEEYEENDPIRRVYNEIRLHSMISHPNIVKFRGWFEDPEHIFLMTQYHPYGSLYQFLHQQPQQHQQQFSPQSQSYPSPVKRSHIKILHETTALSILFQLLDALAYLHSRRMVYRDVKLSNLLLTTTPTPSNSSLSPHTSPSSSSVVELDPYSREKWNISIQLCDFGLTTRSLHPDDEAYTFCGTPNYLPPEIASRNAHSFPVDIWSAGCLLYSLVTGRGPFEACKGEKNSPLSPPIQSGTRDVVETLSRISTGHYTVPDGMSQGFEELLQAMLRMNPDERPTASRLLSAKIFTSLDASRKETNFSESSNPALRSSTSPTSSPTRYFVTTPPRYEVESTSPVEIIPKPLPKLSLSVESLDLFFEGAPSDSPRSVNSELMASFAMEMDVLHLSDEEVGGDNRQIKEDTKLDLTAWSDAPSIIPRVESNFVKEDGNSEKVLPPLESTRLSAEWLAELQAVRRGLDIADDRCYTTPVSQLNSYSNPSSQHLQQHQHSVYHPRLVMESISTSTEQIRERSRHWDAVHEWLRRIPDFLLCIPSSSSQTNGTTSVKMDEYTIYTADGLLFYIYSINNQDYQTIWYAVRLSHTQQALISVSQLSENVVHKTKQLIDDRCAAGVRRTAGGQFVPAPTISRLLPREMLIGDERTMKEEMSNDPSIANFPRLTTPHFGYNLGIQSQELPTELLENSDHSWKSHLVDVIIGSRASPSGAANELSVIHKALANLGDTILPVAASRIPRLVLFFSPSRDELESFFGRFGEEPPVRSYNMSVDEADTESVSAMLRTNLLSSVQGEVSLKCTYMANGPAADLHVEWPDETRLVYCLHSATLRVMRPSVGTDPPFAWEGHLSISTQDSISLPTVLRPYALLSQLAYEHTLDYVSHVNWENIQPSQLPITQMALSSSK